ncbi:MAG: hypothetical protein ACYDCH_08150 [Gaiellaceae bacterium]
MGVAAVLAVPAGIVVSRQTAGLGLIDAAWAIPVAVACAVAAWLLAGSARRRIRLRLGRSGGAGRVRTARILAVAGVCIALSSSIAVGFYELLLRLEK